MEHPVSDRSGDPSVSGRADHFEVAALSTPEVQLPTSSAATDPGMGCHRWQEPRRLMLVRVAGGWHVLARSLSHVARIERRKRRTAPSLGNVQRG
jgi:hypothetical protein